MTEGPERIRMLPIYKKHLKGLVVTHKNIGQRVDLRSDFFNVCAEFKRLYSDEPAQFIVSVQSKESEFQYNLVPLAYIDWVEGARLPPSEIRGSINKIIESSGELQGTITLDLNYVPSQKRYFLPNIDGSFSEDEYIEKIRDLTNGFVGMTLGHLNGMDVKVREVNNSGLQSKIMSHWSQVYISVHWSTAERSMSLDTVLDRRNEILSSLKTSSLGDSPNMSRGCDITAIDFVMPDNYRSLMETWSPNFMYNKHFIHISGETGEIIDFQEALLFASINVIKVFGIQRSELRNQPGRKGVFARTTFNNKCSSIFADMVPRHSSGGEAGELSKGRFSLRILFDRIHNNLVVATGEKFESLDTAVSYFLKVSSTLEGVTIYQDGIVAIKIDDVDARYYDDREQEDHERPAKFQPISIHVDFHWSLKQVKQ